MKKNYHMLLISVALILLVVSVVSCGRREPIASGPVDLEGVSNVEDEYDVMTTSSGMKYIV